jgi:cytosine permease
MECNLPEYVSRSVPVPRARRVPWYSSTFPTYAGVFLWVGFYLQLSGPTLGNASIGVCLLGLLVAGLLCFGLYYYVPAMLGMQTGRPLYVVGSSTFGTAGGYLIPGLLMGFLQIGWVAVIAAVAANFIMKGLNQTSRPLFILIVVAWLVCLAWVAYKGIRYVGRIAKIMNWVPFIMILVVFWWNKGGISGYRPPRHEPLTGFLNVLLITIGYFATAGAAGADFGMNNRDRRDIFLGGAAGIVGGAVIAGGMAVLAVAAISAGRRELPTTTTALLSPALADWRQSCFSSLRRPPWYRPASHRSSVQIVSARCCRWFRGVFGRLSPPL